MPPLCGTTATRRRNSFSSRSTTWRLAHVQAPLRDAPRLRGGLDETRLWRHRTKDGRIIDVEIISQVLTFSGHRAALVLANDVTERRKSEDWLRASEAKYHMLIEAADVAIFLTDAETGRILEANRRAETLLGLPRYRIIGLHQSELHPPEMAPRPHERAGKYRTAKGDVPRESNAGHREGRRIPGGHDFDRPRSGWTQSGLEHVSATTRSGSGPRKRWPGAPGN